MRQAGSYFPEPLQKMTDMKTLLKTTILVLLLAVAFSLQAQKFSIGIKGGAQFANVKVPGFVEDVSFLPDFNSIATPNLGVVSEIELHPNFAIQPELSWTVKGFQVNENFDVNLFKVPVPLGATAISKFNYLELPLLAKAKFGNFYVLAGPTFGYALNGRLQTRADLFLIEVDLFDTAIDLDQVGYERWEVGGMAGAGVSIPVFNGGQIFFDARVSHGFTQPYDLPVVHEKVLHKNIGLNIGFMLPIGGNKATSRA
jgi:Outer membrane protein beta-barrel domain